MASKRGALDRGGGVVRTENPYASVRVRKDRRRRFLSSLVRPLDFPLSSRPLSVYMVVVGLAREPNPHPDRIGRIETLESRVSTPTPPRQHDAYLTSYPALYLKS